MARPAVRVVARLIQVRCPERSRSPGGATRDHEIEVIGTRRYVALTQEEIAAAVGANRKLVKVLANVTRRDLVARDGRRVRILDEVGLAQLPASHCSPRTWFTVCL